MDTMDRKKFGILIKTNTFVILCLIILNCLVLQVHGGSLSLKTESTPRTSECNDWTWIELYPGAGLPTCVNGTWVCPYKWQCESFAYRKINVLDFFCGPCGGIGSRCDLNQDLTCSLTSVTKCLNNWCRCKGDEKYYERYGICEREVPVGLSSEFYILLILLILILIVNKLIKSGKTVRDLWGRRTICCCCLHSGDSDDETSIVGVNERAEEKSASYTMGNNEFMATSDDPELEWALELSLIMRHSNGEWIEGTSSVRPRPSNSTRLQPSHRRSARSIHSVEGSLGRSVQEDCTSVESSEAEDCTISSQIESNTLSKPIPDDSQSVCTRHQECTCTPSTSTSHGIDITSSTSDRGSIILCSSCSNVSFRTRTQTNESSPSTSDHMPSTSSVQNITSSVYCTSSATMM